MITIISILFGAHLLMVIDVKVWTREKPLIREKYEWLLNDWMYLGLAVTIFISAIVIGWLSSGLSGLEVARQIAIGLLIGSEIGDCGFGYILYNGDFMADFKDWFAGWGFKTRRGRIIFDGIRMGTAIGLSIVK